MGACGSVSKAQVEAQLRDAALSKQNYDDFMKRQQRIKLLLLGPGESGKSTLFKQMKVLYGVGFTPEEIANFTLVVHHNIISAMRSLVQACEDFDHEIQCYDELEQFREISDQVVIDKEVAGILKALWADPGVQSAFAARHTFQLHDSTAYYYANLDQISEPDYQATEQDIMRSRTRTSGIVQESYMIDDVPFEIYDVGGQRNERRKWIHCFDDVTAIIFVAAISEYDQVLYEDAFQNRVMEALNLFDEICNSRYFETTSIILFLNKKDVFAEKIRVKPLRQPNPIEGEPDLFEDYTGGTDYDAAISYITGKFKARNAIPDRREVFVKVTCATDKTNVKTVFNSCKTIILKQNMQGSGFME